MLYENGRAAEADAPPTAAPSSSCRARRSSRSTLRAPCSQTNKPDNDREAVRNLELAHAAEIGQLRPVAADGGGLFQAQQSRHDLARARRDGDPARPARRGAGPCRRRRRAPVAVRHAGLAARAGHQGLRQHAAGQEPVTAIWRSAHAFDPSWSSVRRPRRRRRAARRPRHGASRARICHPAGRPAPTRRRSARASATTCWPIRKCWSRRCRSSSASRTASATPWRRRASRRTRRELCRDPDSPIAGNPNGDVVIVEFNDYQCPYCKRTHQAVKSVVGADGKVKLIYKDLPILGEAVAGRRPRGAGRASSRASTSRCTTR